jgi:hypothetical protein
MNRGQIFTQEDCAMQTIETSISVNTDGSAVLAIKLPENLAAGVHRAVLIVEEQPVLDKPTPDTSLDLLPMAFQGWPDDCTFRREDLYGDDGR